MAIFPGKNIKHSYGGENGQRFEKKCKVLIAIVQIMSKS
jgi:hypothetical protein